MSQSATLCPAGMASLVRTGRPSTLSSVPAGRATRAMATLSGGCRGIAERSAVVMLVISISIGSLSLQIHFATRNVGMDVQPAIHGMDPDAIAIARDGDIGGVLNRHENLGPPLVSHVADVV